jgi:ATP-binding cassette subfamily B protein
VVWTAGHQIMVGKMELGTLTAFITYLSQILMALNFLANIVLQGTRAAASDRRITEVLTAEIDITDDTAAYPKKHISGGSITFEHVSFRYFKNNHQKVLDDINLSIGSGETVGIIGSTGSGKSTLISLISRLYDADEGRVLVDGIDVRDYSLYHLRESVSVVLQKNTLFSGTIAENLRWGCEDASQEEVERAAVTAAADAFIRTFPAGYETEIGQGGVNLSGGQKQRLCIARALLKKPQILILDDSTSAVDTATESSIRLALRTELPGVTKIIIAQRITSVVDADHIIVLDEGRIAGYGTHTELLETCIPYQEIYYSQKDKEAV